jgi:DNA-binding transcriptional MerR regulator
MMRHYLEQEALKRIKEIQELKPKGLTLSEIIKELKGAREACNEKNRLLGSDWFYYCGGSFFSVLYVTCIPFYLAIGLIVLGIFIYRRTMW